MKIKDRRTDEQKKTLTYLVVGTDSFMSGWGEARDGASYAAWACKPEHVDNVLDKVEARDDMKRVRVVTEPYSPQCAHLSIYPIHDEHPYAPKQPWTVES